jgi:hypothetical protein
MGGHVACMGEMRNAYIIFVGNLNGRNYVEDLDVNGNIIFELILGK